MLEPGAGYATVFDLPPALVAPPVAITSGLDPSLRLSDGLRRLDDRVGLCSGSATLLGFAMPPLQPVRVEIDVAWARSQGAPGLVGLRSGSASAIFLVPGPVVARAGRRVTLCLDVPGSEIPQGGLLLIEIVEAGSHLPEGLRRRVRHAGPHGLNLLEVRLTTPAGPAVGSSAVRVTVDGGIALVQGGGGGTVNLDGRLLRPRRPSKGPDKGGPPAAEGRPNVIRRPPPRGFYADAPERRDPGRAPRRATVVGAAALRVASRVVPPTVQRWLVAANLRVVGSSSLRRVVAVDTVSGLPVDVDVTARGARLVLRMVEGAPGPVIVDLRAPGNSQRFGCGARWIHWTPAP